ncbi:unnamed protein product [Discula destructiva]
MDTSPYRIAAAALAVTVPALFLLNRSTKNRRHLSSERVLVLGASSGLGRSIAQHYVRRGARVCVVARRGDKLAEFDSDYKCLVQVADMTAVQDMVRVRSVIQSAWGGLDTVHVCAGVSALQPLMALAGVREGVRDDASAEGVQAAVEVAGRAMKGNFEGPLVAAVTFIPMLERTSQSPSILLVSSAAAIIPAPTRALYASSKASSLLLYQALAIEHRSIAFSFLLPSTIEGNFRASAVDAGPVREADPNKHGLKTEYVAGRCIDAVDKGITGTIVIPWFYTLGWAMYYIWPAVIERAAMKKYNFP